MKTYLKILLIKLKDKLGLTEYGTFRFYLKSGNQVVADYVNADKFRINYSGNTITMISGWQQHAFAKHRLMIESFDLSQIELIVREL